MTLDSPDPGVKPVGPVEFLGVDERGPLFVDARGATTHALALYRRQFEPPPVGGPGGLAARWCADAYAQADRHGVPICPPRAEPSRNDTAGPSED